MKKLLLLLVAVLTAGMALAQDVPAFPGAEGHGRYVTGGRGGVVRHVTNLNDSGTGSLRAAVSGASYKIVVFDVAGVIALKSDLNIGANTTIEGQTAPSPGITLRYYTVRPGANNIIRFMRFRRGQEKNINDGADATWQTNVTGLILDHCSFSWSIDEVASFYDNNNFTMQWCTLGESLVHPGHSKGAHGYGGIWGGKLASFHHNMIVHVANRSPRFCGARYGWTGYNKNQLYDKYKWENSIQAEMVDYRNCVVYNCGNGCYGGPGGGRINFVNNVYKTGPAAKTNRLTTVTVGASGNSTPAAYYGMTSRYYLSGNQLDNNAEAGWDKVNYDSGTYLIDGERWSKDPNHYNGSDVEYKQNANGEDCVRIRLDEPIDAGDVTTHSAAQAYEKVLAYAGARMYRDDVDQRYVRETTDGTCTYKGSATSYVENGTTKSCTPTLGRIDLVSDVNGYTEENFGTGSRPTGYDTDNDGMPDAWETANGLDPNDGNDAKTYTLDPKGWYTNVEVYCNAIVEDLIKAQNADAEDAVDEYYPTVAKAQGINYYSGELLPDPNDNPGGGDDPVEGVDVEYTIAQSTYVSDVSKTEWSFAGDITVSNSKDKAYAAGFEDGIKYSAGVQYTVNLPSGVTIDKATFTGYDNYAEVDAYLSELNGTGYGSTDYVFPQKNASGDYFVKSYTVETNASGKMTFTPAGKQTVWVITLNGKSTSTGIADNMAEGHVLRTSYYDVTGKELKNPYAAKGLIFKVERLSNGKVQTTKMMR